MPCLMTVLVLCKGASVLPRGSGEASRFPEAFENIESLAHFHSPEVCVALFLQDVASMGLELLEAISDALADWSATVGRAVQRLTTSTRQPALQQDAAAELHETRTWLLLAAGSMLQCMWSEVLYSKVHEQQLLDTLGQLLRRVLPSSLSSVAR